MDKHIFRCQSCRAKLNIGGLDSLPDADLAHTSSGFKNASSTVGGSKVDESFIMLDNGTRKAAQGTQPVPFLDS